MPKSSSGRKSKRHSASTSLSPEEEDIWRLANEFLLAAKEPELAQYRASAFLAQKLPDDKCNDVVDGVLRSYDSRLAKAEGLYDEAMDLIPAWRKVRDAARAETRAKK